MKKIIAVLAIVFFTYNAFNQTITIDPTKEYQTIFGFGGHGVSSDPGYLKYLVDYMGVSVVRHAIEYDGASSVDNINNGIYTFDALEKNSNEALNYFKNLKNRSVKVVATCWTPPACLKKNLCYTQRAQAVVGGPYICGQPCAKPMCPNGYNSADPDNYMLPEYYDEYARYLCAWTKDFQTKTGVSLQAINLQNEPLFNEPYGSAILESYNFGTALKPLHDTFAKYTETQNIKFFGPEHMGSWSRNNGGDGTDSRFVQDLLWNTANRPLLDIYAVHGYSDGIAPDLGNAAGWTNFDTCVRKYGKDLWMSETGTGGDGTDWNPYPFNFAKGIFVALKYGKINAWINWGMSAFYNSGSANKFLYAGMHFYRFIRPGYIMIDVTESDADVAAVAFKNPGTSDITVVAINISSTTKKTIQLNDFTNKPAFFHMYRSSPLESCSYLGKITDNKFELGPLCIATLYYKASEPDVVYGPNPPSNLTATNITDNSITVTWTKASGWTLKSYPTDQTIAITGSIVYIDGIKKTPSGPTTATTWTFTGLLPGSTHTIEIFSRDAMLNQSMSAKLVATTTCSAGNCIPDSTGIEKIACPVMVSPNPSAEIINVSAGGEIIREICLIDVSGILRKNITVNSDAARIDISGLEQGVYIIMINTGEKNYKSRFVKQ